MSAARHPDDGFVSLSKALGRWSPHPGMEALGRVLFSSMVATLLAESGVQLAQVLSAHLGHPEAGGKEWCSDLRVGSSYLFIRSAARRTDLTVDGEPLIGFSQRALPTFVLDVLVPATDSEIAEAKARGRYSIVDRFGRRIEEA